MAAEYVLNPMTAAAHMNSKMEVGLTVVANFSWQHLKAATLFRSHLIRLEKEHADQLHGGFVEEIRSYGSACIMSTAACLEALINELFIAHNCQLRALLSEFESQFWGRQGIEGKPILDKYQVALQMLKQPQFDKREPIYRNAWALIELRNALVHYKPTWDPARERKIQLVEELAGKFDLSPFAPAGNDFVSEKCMSAGCATWSIRTALALISEFDSRTHLDDGKLAGIKELGKF